MPKKFDVVVVGAGAAGLMCAATAGYQGRSVLVIDSSDKPAKKVLMSGGGRCNFTNLNTSPAHYLSSNPDFCISALQRYRPQAFVELVERHGIDYVEKAPGQLFCANSSKDIQQLLLTEADWAGCQLHLRSQVQQVTPTAAGVKLKTSLGLIDAGCLVVATGGLSIPTLGSSGWGYNLARELGLELVPTRAGLVPFTLPTELKQHFVPLAGLSCQVKVSCHNTSFTDALLITHRGLSGPVMLQMSNFWQPGQVLSLDWLPGLNVVAELTQMRQQQPRSSINSWLSAYLPKRLAALLIELLQQQGLVMPPRVADLSNQLIQELAQGLSYWLVLPAGTEGYRTAEVTLGGVATDKISSQNFAVQDLEQVRFIGEVLDVTGQLGGYNFQWAWSSAVACGTSM